MSIPEAYNPEAAQQNNSPEIALERLKEAGTFEQEREAVITKLLLKEELKSLQDQIEALINNVLAVPTKEIDQKAQTVRTRIQQVSAMLNELKTQTANADESNESTVTEFSLEEQQQFARILLTPLTDTDMDPEVTTDYNGVFIGDIILAIPPHHNFGPASEGKTPHKNPHKEKYRVIEAMGGYTLLEKFAKAHNIDTTQNASDVTLRAYLNPVFENLKEALIRAARAAKK